MISNKYQIRKMGARGLRHRYLCSGSSGNITCTEAATHYLVRKVSLFQDKAESRTRKCMVCAMIDAKSLGITDLSALAGLIPDSEVDDFVKACKSEGEK